MAATFHFCKESPPDGMFTDIQALNKFQGEQFSQLVEMVFSFLAEPSKSSRLLSQLGEFAAENNVSPSALKNVFKSLLSVPNSAVKRGVSAAQLNEDLINLGLSEEKTNFFIQQWKNNLVTLSSTALGQTLIVNQLVDMEWKFGVTAASSELDKVGNTFLQLKLVLNNGSDDTNNVYMELTLSQFYQFLHEMEKAKSSLELLS